MKHITLCMCLIFASQSLLAQYKLYEKGHDSYKSEKYDQAIKYFSEYLTKAMRDKSIDTDVFYLRALSYYKTKDYPNAIPDFEETLLRGHPNRGNIYWFMAKCYLQLDQADESLRSYTNAIRELSDNRESKAKLLYERSIIHSRQGKPALAAADIQNAYALQPGNPEIRKEYDKFRNSSSQNESVETANEPSTPSVATASPLAERYKDERRFALVIGNSEYPRDIGSLRHSINDATDIASELKDSHFEVQLLTNATYGQIRVALMRFKEKLDAGDPNKTVGLFYFAGHAIHFQDENFLVPVDAAVQYEDDIPRYCFPIQRIVLANMERSNSRMNIVILDASGRNPFPSVSRSLGTSGLDGMKAKGSFIAYSTAAGSDTFDNPGRNGLYTQELVKAIQKPGLTIEQVFKEVRANVLRISSNRQTPWDSSNIMGDFHFKY